MNDPLFSFCAIDLYFHNDITKERKEKVRKHESAEDFIKVFAQQLKMMRSNIIYPN